MIKCDLIQWFLEKTKLTDCQQKAYLENITNQLELISQEIKDDQQKEIAQQKIFNMLPIALDQSSYFFATAPNARTLISQLFEKNVTHNTLIITSDAEHWAVNNILANYQNVYRMSINTHMKNYSKYVEFNDDFFSYVKQFENVFVYCIGTTPGSGIVLPQDFFEHLIFQLRSHGIKFKIAIDAVQELFLYPRNYNIFDYVIGTSHAIIPNFNTGLMFSRDGAFSSIHKSILAFANMFGFIQQKIQYINQFSHLLNDTYYMLCKYKINVSNNIGYICSIGDHKQTFKQIASCEENTHILTSYYAIQFRATYAMFLPTDFIQKINRLNIYLKQLGYDK